MTPPHRPNRSHRRRKATLDRLLTGASLLLIVLAGWALVRRPPGPDPTRIVPEALAGARGRPLPSMTSIDKNGSRTHVQLVGKTHLIYIFSTTCRFCASQQKYIGGVLAKLDAATVITASEEPQELVGDYWSRAGIRMQSPISIDGREIRSLGINGVPALIFVAPNGTVSDAFIGTAFGWDRAEFEKRLAEAEANGPVHVTHAVAGPPTLKS
jgi:hypothetical protein